MAASVYIMHSGQYSVKSFWTQHAPVTVPSQSCQPTLSRRCVSRCETWSWVSIMETSWRTCTFTPAAASLLTCPRPHASAHAAIVTFEPYRPAVLKTTTRPRWTRIPRRPRPQRPYAPTATAPVSTDQQSQSDQRSTISGVLLLQKHWEKKCISLSCWGVAHCPVQNEFVYPV